MPWGNAEESVLEKFLREIVDSHPMTVRCAFCPKWKATGTTEETRKAQEEHIKDKHPEKARPQRKSNKRRSAWSKKMSVERENQIDEERKQRMFLLGITGEEGEDDVE